MTSSFVITITTRRRIKERHVTIVERSGTANIALVPKKAES